MRACLCLAFALTAITPADEPGPSFPGKTWEARTPEAVGLDPAALDGLRSAFGGRGCVIRHGRLGFQWGDIAQRADVASAVKPVFAHFLLRALQEKRIDSLDTPVVRFEPRLADLNPELGHKDRSITFRQMIFQTSCYGVSEAPGTAFDYNDWQMALLADTLFLKVYASTYERLDQEVVGSRLFDAIGCEDQPGFRAPGGRGSVGRLAISVRDFARFGWLYRNEGRWNGKEILRPDLARMAVTSPLHGAFPRTEARPAALIAGQRTLGSTRVPDNQTDHFGSYSFAWWTNGVDRAGQRHWPGVPLDTYAALGHGGRRGVAVIPSLDLVVSWNDATITTREAQAEALRRVAKAVVTP